MISQILDICFPRRCPVCGEIPPAGSRICPECLDALHIIRQPVCFRCGKELESPAMEYCSDCARKARSFVRSFALLQYNQAAARSMAAVKYNNRREYLDFYGEAFCRRYGPQILRLRPDAAVPVPIHPSRRRERGFNQAEELAVRLGRQLDVPVYPDALRRVKKTAPQKNLDPAQRLANLRQAFAPGTLPREVGTVLLVDDIYTTGSTMEACSRVLLSMGVKTVYGAVLCVGGS